MSDYRIIPAQRRYCAGHARTLTYVAEEGKYLSRNTGFSETDTAAFYEYCRVNNFPQLLVVDSQDEVVGWCDIVTREEYPARIGFIGVGLMPEYRGRGIGGEVMTTAMAMAKECGFNEIRLDCRRSNTRAIALYKKLGFRRAATMRSALVIDGERIPLVCMRKKI